MVTDINLDVHHGDSGALSSASCCIEWKHTWMRVVRDTNSGEQLIPSY